MGVYASTSNVRSSLSSIEPEPKYFFTSISTSFCFYMVYFWVLSLPIYMQSKTEPTKASGRFGTKVGSPISK